MRCGFHTAEHCAPRRAAGSPAHYARRALGGARPFRKAVWFRVGVPSRVIFHRACQRGADWWAGSCAGEASIPQRVCQRQPLQVGEASRRRSFAAPGGGEREAAGEDLGGMRALPQVGTRSSTGVVRDTRSLMGAYAVSLRAAGGVGGAALVSLDHTHKPSRLPLGWLAQIAAWLVRQSTRWRVLRTGPARAGRPPSISSLLFTHLQPHLPRTRPRP
jgi:hypothetical protein